MNSPPPHLSADSSPQHRLPAAPAPQVGAGAPEQGGERGLWDTVTQAQREDMVYEISDLLQRRLVSSTLASEFRSVMELHMQVSKRVGFNGCFLDYFSASVVGAWFRVLSEVLCSHLASSDRCTHWKAHICLRGLANGWWFENIQMLHGYSIPSFCYSQCMWVCVCVRARVRTCVCVCVRVCVCACL